MLNNVTYHIISHRNKMKKIMINLGNFMDTTKHVAPSSTVTYITHEKCKLIKKINHMSWSDHDPLENKWTHVHDM